MHTTQWILYAKNFCQSVAVCPSFTKVRSVSASSFSLPSASACATPLRARRRGQSGGERCTLNSMPPATAAASACGLLLRAWAMLDAACLSFRLPFQQWPFACFYKCTRRIFPRRQRADVNVCPTKHPISPLAHCSVGFQLPIELVACTCQVLDLFSISQHSASSTRAISNVPC